MNLVIRQNPQRTRWWLQAAGSTTAQEFLLRRDALAEATKQRRPNDTITVRSPSGRIIIQIPERDST